MAKAGGKLSNFGPLDEWNGPLHALHASLDTEGGLSFFGRWAVEQASLRRTLEFIAYLYVINTHTES